MNPDFKTCKMSISDKCSLNAHKSEFKGSYCRPCYKEYSRSYYQLNRDKLLARANARYVRTGEPRGRPKRFLSPEEYQNTTRERYDDLDRMELAGLEGGWMDPVRANAIAYPAVVLPEARELPVVRLP